MPSQKSVSRKADTLGSYYPNEFFITLSEDTPFLRFEQDGTNWHDNTYLPTFIHEYWHYLQNISTIGGYKLFSLDQQVLALFSNTLTPDGRCPDSVQISGDEQSFLSGIQDLRNSIEGVPAPTGFFNAGGISSIVQGLTPFTGVTSWHNGGQVGFQSLKLTVDLSTPSGNITGLDFILGTWVLEESVALLTEALIAGEQTDALNAPEFPYRVLERIFEHFGLQNDSYLAMAKVGTLALLTANPGYALKDLMELYKLSRESGFSEEEAYSRVEAATMPQIIPSIDMIIDTELPSIINAHSERGLVAKGSEYICNIYKKALSLRKTQPMFDLDVFSDRDPTEALLQLHNRFPPCDTLQIQHGKEDDVLRDQLASFHDSGPLDEHGHSPSDFLRPFQAQKHFVASHVSPLSRTILPSSTAVGECPYYTSCDNQWRTDQPHVCKSQPWLNYNRSDRVGCWYTMAVASTFSTGTQKKIGGN